MSRRLDWDRLKRDDLAKRTNETQTAGAIPAGGGRSTKETAETPMRSLREVYDLQRCVDKAKAEDERAARIARLQAEGPKKRARFWRRLTRRMRAAIPQNINLPG